MRKGITLVVIIIALIALGIFIDTPEEKNHYILMVPESDKVSSINLKSDREYTVERPSEIKYILRALKEYDSSSGVKNESSYPVDATELVEIKLEADDGSENYYVYEKDGEYYLDSSNFATYRTSKSIFECFRKFLEEDEREIDRFYDDELANEYIRMSKVTPYYSIGWAVEDENALVMFTENNYNYKLYEVFIEKSKNGESAFLRIHKSTFDGSNYNYDIKYTEEGATIVYNKFDTTEETKTKIKNFKNMEEYTFNGSKYLVFYDDEFSDKDLKSDTDAFMIEMKIRKTETNPKHEATNL